MLSWCYTADPNPHLKKKIKYSNALYRIWKMKQKMSQIIPLCLLCIAHALCPPSTHEGSHSHANESDKIEIINECWCAFSPVEERTASSAARPQLGRVPQRPQSRGIHTPPTANSHSASCKVVSTEHLIVCDGTSLLSFAFFPFPSLWPGRGGTDTQTERDTHTHASLMHPSLVLHTVITWTKCCIQIMAFSKNPGCSGEMMSQIVSSG